MDPEATTQHVTRVCPEDNPAGAHPRLAGGLRGVAYGYAITGGLLLAATLVTPEVVAAVTYNGITLLATVVLLAVGAQRRARPASGWLLAGLGMLCIFVGDTIWNVYAFVLHREPFPSAADASS
jgi:hypothetical protein